jgi:hypothetical protein
MKLSLVVTRDELAALAAELVPVRIVLREHPYSAVSFGRALKLDLIEKQGIRIRGDARIALSVAGLTMQVGVRAWQILLRPAITGEVPALAFDPVLEDLDLERVPGFLDERIVEGVNEALAGGRQKLAWRFAEKLGALRTLPAKVSPRGTFRFVASSATAVVTSTELRFDVDLRPELALERRPAAPAPPQQPAQPRPAAPPPGTPSSRSARA